MEFTIRQFLASVLITAGLFVVFWDITTSYYYFSAQKEFPQVFVNNQTTTTGNGATTGTDIQNQIGNIVKDQISQMIPENTVTQLLNMTSWIIFASFMLWAGGKLFGMGSDLLKKRQE
ncbi:MAG TPA: hypothetical protein PLD14_00200 [Candidatus Pacearchaeota archaeon]|nr:hypothetical protein [Candidatus Pacearchaeota archaeon]HPR79635.1 hypothetical protein [Candidatus Pacearchaeota archaeon]